MLQFLPINLSIDDLLKSNPPAFTHHIDNFVHLLSLLTEVPCKNPDAVNEKGYVSLNATLLKRRFYNYNKHLKYLIQHSIIECDNSYIPGKKSKGYRFTEKYRTKIVPIEIKKYTLTKSIKARGSFDRNMKAKYDYLYKWFNEDLRIDIEAAQKHLEDLYWNDIKNGDMLAWQKYNIRLSVALRISRNEHYFRVDETSGRLHTNLSTIKKELRNYITYNGKRLVSVDISCSQPTLSTVLLNPNFYCKKGGELSINRFYSADQCKVPLCEISELVKASQPKSVTYLDAVKEDLYMFLKPKLEVATHRPWNDRQELKSVVFSVLYSDNRFIAQKEALPKRLFRELFPEVYEVFTLFKRSGAAQLPILLQKMEVKLVLDAAAKRFAKLYPGLPLYSIHDSLISIDGYQGTLSEIITQEAVGLFNLNIKTKIEVWGSQSVL